MINYFTDMTKNQPMVFVTSEWIWFVLQVNLIHCCIMNLMRSFMIFLIDLMLASILLPSGLNSLFLLVFPTSFTSVPFNSLWLNLCNPAPSTSISSVHYICQPYPATKILWNRSRPNFYLIDTCIYPEHYAVALLKCFQWNWFLEFILALMSFSWQWSCTLARH